VKHRFTKKEIYARLSDPDVRAKVEWLLSEPPTKVRGPEEAEELVRPLLAGRETESLVCVALDQGARVIAAEVLTTGSHRYTVVDPVQVLRWALTRSRPPASIVIAHNHPSSGDPTPSLQDYEVTRRIQRSALAVGVPLHDHLIVGEGETYSFAKHGDLVSPDFEPSR